MKIFKLKDHQLIPTEECYSFPELKVLIDRDKSANKTKAFNGIGFVFHMCDPISNFFNYPSGIKEQEIIKSFIQDSKFKQDKEIKNAIIAYKKSIETAKQRMLNMWTDKMDEITDYIKRLPVDEDTIKLLMEAATKVGNIISTIDKLEISLEKGKDKEDKVRGNNTLSFLEKRS